MGDWVKGLSNAVKIVSLLLSILVFVLQQLEKIQNGGE